MQSVVLWNIEWLKQRLQQCPLSGRDTYIYSFLWLTTISLYLYVDVFKIDTPLPTAFLISDVLITAFGMVYVWLCNGGRGGKEFFSRFIAIGWVMAVRIIVFSFPLFISLGLLPIEQSLMICDTVAALLSVLFFWRLGHHIEKL